VLVFLVRHAHSDPGEPDELRPLSERGRAEARTLAEGLAAHETPRAVVLTSPLARAGETAELIARVTGSDVRADDRLGPGTTLDLLREALVGVDGPVAVVAHQPDCSEIALALTGHDPGFPPAGVLELELS
jgi:phosphohistidine phosphatase SixA